MNKITKNDLINLNEEDLMFITSPGRMGDEDGSTFVMKKGNDLVVYRVEGWMWQKERDENFITFEDLCNVFPKWSETLENFSNENYNGKYIYIYMGFGNGLCVDKSIYDEYYPYLIEEVKKQENYSEEDGKYDPSLNYISWEPALVKMINDRKNK